MGMQISLGYLAFHPTVTKFLADNLHVANQLGQDGSDESRFVAASERMTNSGLLFGSTPESKSIRAAFHAITNNRRFGSLFPETSKASKNKFLDIETSSFLATRTELLSLFKDSPDLRQALEKDLGSDGFDVAHALATVAQSRLGPSTPISTEDLEQHPQEALLVALNIGGAADLLRENSNLARSFLRDPADAWQDVVSSRVAEKAASMFKQGSPIDETFLRNHRRTAIYLLEHPARVRSLNANIEKARDFVHTANEFESQLEPYITSRASELLENKVAFDESRISSIPGFAELLVGDFLTRDDGTLVGFINNNIATTREDTTFRELLGDQFARAAVSRLPQDSPFDLEYLKSNPGIAGLVIASDSFLNGLANDRDLVNRFVNVQGLESMPMDTERRRAIAAFSSGFATRSGITVDVQA